MSETEKQLQEQLDEAIDLLRSVLYESVVENEYDEDIYDFLKEYNHLTDDEIFYGDNYK